MSQLKFCPNCGNPVDPSEDGVVNGSHEPHGESGYYHEGCCTRVLKQTHDADVFQNS